MYRCVSRRGRCTLSGSALVTGWPLAVDVFEPKRDARETWIIEIDDAGRSVAGMRSQYVVGQALD